MQDTKRAAITQRVVKAFKLLKDKVKLDNLCANHYFDLIERVFVLEVILLYQHIGPFSIESTSYFGRILF